MLKVPDHQVAGHRAGDGQLGPLIDDSGHFYKPLQSGERGTREEAFYKSFSSDTRISNNVRRFFPIFYGTQLLEASDGSGLLPHLVLQDLMSTRVNASIMDVKMGSRTWYPQASEEYVQSCLKRDKDTTSPLLGFRITGLQLYDHEDSSYWKPAKKLVQAFDVDDVRLVMKNFVSSNPSINDSYSGNPDCSLAVGVYSGSSGILAQLLELKAWFEDQTTYHFNSCSILMVYEKEPVLGGKGPKAEIKLVDFAHVVDGQGIIDHNFLGGLCSLIKFVSEIAANSDHMYTQFQQ